MKKTFVGMLFAVSVVVVSVGCKVEETTTPGSTNTVIKDSKTVDVPATDGTVKTTTTTTTTG